LSYKYLSRLASGLPTKSLPRLATTNLDYRTTKGYLEVILNKLGLDYKFTAIGSFGPFQSNTLSQIKINGITVGHFGLIKTIVKGNFGIEDEVCLAQLDFSLLAKHSSLTKTITLPSSYPDIVDDITIQSDKPIGQIIDELSQSHPLITTVTYLESLANKHTFRLHFNNPKSNLTQEEVNQIKLVLHL
jgi:phenylalanyl-tRNA synthetase beta subunit